MPRKSASPTSTQPADDGAPASPDAPVSASVMEQRLARQAARAEDPNAKDMKTVLFESGTKPIIGG